jgi:hypothetical protein
MHATALFGAIESRASETGMTIKVFDAGSQAKVPKHDPKCFALSQEEASK